MPESPALNAAGWRHHATAAWQATVRAYHRYATWLVSISWKRFALLSLLLIIVAAIAQSLPPFSWRVTETTVVEAPPAPPVPPAMPTPPKVKIERPGSPGGGVDISIDDKGVHIRQRPRQPPASSAASAASVAPSISASAAAAPSAPSAASATAASSDAAGAWAAAAASAGQDIVVELPPGADSSEVKAALKEAMADVKEALRDAAQAQRDAAEAARDAREAYQAQRGAQRRTKVTHFGDFLTDLALLWIAGSAILKITYKGRLQAEVKAAQATETAEAESLKRQVVEARMAAMQAQVEPHFLFNTLASIDHLIETDPPRASQMQKNLIALLRASMPTMREAQDSTAPRDLKRELDVIRPYLEILKVRMEERLATRIDVPDGLLSAEFPPMMIQTLVENAIKHGLEPKAEGGELVVKAEIVHGKLALSVADTGLGFGQAPTAGTGVGLANIRARLQLLYGDKGSLTITGHSPQGTVATITVPYKSLEGRPA